MESRCSEADVFDQKTGDIDGMLDMDHIAECPQCARLMQGHQELTLAFKSTPRSTPSIYFDRKLSQRLHEERRREHQIRLRMIALRSYWFLAAVASFLILWLVPWPEQAFPSTVVVSIGAFLGLLAIVPTMIYRSLRYG